MDRRDVVRRVLDVLGLDSMGDCRRMASRLRKALIDANPDLSERSMAVYDQAMGEELPALADAARRAHIEAAATWLSEDQLALWRTVLEIPDIELFFASIRTLTPEFQRVTKSVFLTRGVGVHARASERLFDSLAAEQVAAGKT